MRPASASVVCIAAIGIGLGEPTSAAEIYKCIQDGKVVYQDQRCRGRGSALPAPPPAQGAVASSEQGLAALKAQVTEMERERRSREIAQEIGRLERTIAGYERARESELEPLRERQRYINYNYAGDTWELNGQLQTVQSEMQAVNDKYRAMSDTAHDRLVQLRNDAKALAPTANPPSR